MEKAQSNHDNKSLSVTKRLNAPISVVWDAWTNPDQIAQWWGPNGFTNTIHNMEVMPNGVWHSTMHGPDGENYPNKSMFLEVVPFKKIRFQHFNPNYLATITFEEKGKETYLEWTMEFETEELFETVVKVFKADEGLYQNVEKLEHFLKQKL